ncbi:MAG TPA: Tex family protein [Fibrobacteria bacterium]|nr:Tex family protein [Fibrobacteria bacterium]
MTVKTATNIAEIIAAESRIPLEGVRNTLALFEQGATVPFITRYRKEATGGLDENQIRLVEERFAYFKELEERRDTVRKSIEAQGKLTPELDARIAAAVSRTALEDLYLPYKPKRRTRATAAREAGLEPLARMLGAQDATDKTPEQLAAEYVNAEKGVADAAAAVKGALDILAEELSEDPDLRASLRELALAEGVLASHARKDWEGKRSKFEMYYSFREKAKALPSHRVLAMRRGEKENVLRTELQVDEAKVLGILGERVIRPSSPFRSDLEAMTRDAWERLLKPAVETEVRLLLRERAEAEAFKVFQRNLSDVLLAPPAGGKVVMGVDPGFRTGVKLAVVDATGKLLEHRTIHPHQPQKQVEASTTILLGMIEAFKVEIIAIGNGTASRETDAFVAEAFKQLENPPIKVIVSEAGASVYSVSPVAGKEFPDLDATIRSAASIARRVQDPLAELVKIEPKSIGVGQYQHDVSQSGLKLKLEQVVESCVNRVGVDVNQASEPLLAQVSGVNKALAKAIVEYRDANGPFPSRSALVKVPHFGPKAFEQAAGFLRVRGENPLDASAVHPERYELVKKMCEEAGIPLAEVVGNAEAVRKLDLGKYVSGDVGLPTLTDIAVELEKPARDPRSAFAYARFNAKVQDLKDLQEGMQLEGVVTNVTAFGAFVDIGVHQDGLVHVSELSDRFVQDPSKVVAPGQVVQVRVLGVDMEQKRISLSMKKGAPQGAAQADGKGRPQGKGPGKPGKQPAKPKATMDDLLQKFAAAGPQRQNNVKLAVSLKSLLRSGR